MIDGQEDGAPVAPAELSGFKWVPGEWYKVVVEGDFVTRSWTFSVNDFQYAAPDPLGFRGSPTYIDRVFYSNGGASTIYLDALTITPEPSTLALAFIGASAGITWHLSRRRRCRYQGATGTMAA